MAEIIGSDPAPSGQEPVDKTGAAVPVGVWGDSTTGIGVFGSAGEPWPTDDYIVTRAGVYGLGTQGQFQGEGYPYYWIPGVYGGSPFGVGVVGVCGSEGGETSAGVIAINNSEEKMTYGLQAQTGVEGGEGDAVYGLAWQGAGVHGSSISGIGVWGEGFEGIGVYGESETCAVHGGVYANPEYGGAIGVYGESLFGSGVEGWNYGDAAAIRGNNVSSLSHGDASGVFGASVVGDGVQAFSGFGNGVHGQSFSRDRGTAAILGENYLGWAGLFSGNVSVVGLLFKSGGGFLVDHPTDPQNKYLSHSFVESPEMLNVYSGTVTTDGTGNARVELPDYFEALNGDFRYQLTAIGQFAQLMVAEEISQNSFAIRSDMPHVKVCWEVTGVRRDAWANANRIPVEEDKPDNEKGRFLHPELFGEHDAVHRSTRRWVETVAAEFPDDLRDRAVEILSEMAATGGTDSADLDDLVSQARESKLQAASERRALREERERRRPKIAEHLRRQAPPDRA